MPDEYESITSEYDRRQFTAWFVSTLYKTFI